MDCLNVFLFQQINQFAGRSQTVDLIVKIIAVYLPILFVVFLFLSYFSAGGRNKKIKAISAFSLFSATLGIAANIFIHAIYYHPRPFALSLGRQILTHSADASFPSDHATFMGSIAFFLLFFKETRLAGVILSILALAGGFSRVFCGIHFPFDIFGFIVVSLTVSFASYAAYRFFNKRLLLGAKSGNNKESGNDKDGRK